MSLLAGAWPLVGRDRELAEIAAARTDGACHGVVLVAEAGVGKTRLAREAQATAQREGAFVQWVQATRSAATVPLAAVADLVPETVRSDDVVALMRRCGDDLRARAQGRPVVLGVDDAQLLDPVSAALVLHLATSDSAFILATVRTGEPCPDAIVSLWKDDAARRVELGALDDEEIRALVETALGDPVEEAALRWVTDVSRGNALYVRELVRSAVEEGALVHGSGFWRLDGRPATSASLVELVERRMSEVSASERDLAELLALGEPLALTQVAELGGDEALIAAEAHGLVTMSAGEVRLGHPVFGEAVRTALPPLRARGLRLRLAQVLQSRTPLAPDDALRVARLLLDAGASLPPKLALDAARAANHACDPDLGAQLAERAGASTDVAAAILLAQAHAMRNRSEEAEAALVAVEPLVPGSLSAHDYLRQRLWLYQWGLRRPDAIGPLMDRADTWADDDSWRRFTRGIRRTYSAIADGVSAPPPSTSIPDDPWISEAVGRARAALRRMSVFIGGRGDVMAAEAFADRPIVPMDDADLGELGTLVVILLETGYRWADVELYMSQVVREGVRARDHGAVGLAAFALARLHFLRGEYADTTRWLAEAEVHLAQRDPFNAVATVRALQVGVACYTGDFDGTMAALDRMHTWCESHPPMPLQRVPLRRAEGWALRMRNPVQAGRQLLADAAALDEMPGLTPQLVYDAMRAGVPAAAELEAVAARCESRLVTAYARHAAANASHDGTALAEVADEMAAIGALRYAVEAASDAAAAFVAAGREDSARRAAARARELHAPDRGGELPVIDGLDAAAVELTPREAQLIDLASQGLSNAEIADRLVISVRTVETHLYRGMQKLGVGDRRELARRG